MLRLKMIRRVSLYHSRGLETLRYVNVNHSRALEQTRASWIAKMRNLALDQQSEEKGVSHSIRVQDDASGSAVISPSLLSILIR